MFDRVNFKPTILFIQTNTLHWYNVITHNDIHSYCGYHCITSQAFAYYIPSTLFYSPNVAPINPNCHSSSSVLIALLELKAKNRYSSDSNQCY